MKAPILDETTIVYINSIDTDVLKDSAIKLTKAINSKAYEDIKEGLNNLLNRIILKFTILEYFASEYKSYDTFNDKITNLIAKITDKSSIYELAIYYQNYIKQLDTNLTKYRLTNDILFKDGLFVGDNETLNEATKNINESIDLVTKMEEGYYEKGVTMIKPKDNTIVYLNHHLAMINDEQIKINNKLDDEIAKQYVSEITSFNYEYAPYVDYAKEAKTIIIHSPIQKEIDLLVYAYAKKYERVVYKIDGASLKNINKSIINAIISYLNRNNVDVYINNTNHISDGNIKVIIPMLIGYAKNTNHKVFIEDSNANNTLYINILSTIKEDNTLSYLDISYMYLSLPRLEELIDLLVSKKMLVNNTDPNALVLKQDMPFLGFYGLNQIVREYYANNKWINIGKSISNINNDKALKKYIKELPNESLFIDSSYDLSEIKEQIITKHGNFDYDLIRNVNINNIKKILDDKFNIFEKCGNIVRYCLSAGEDFRVYKNISKEEKIERITLAVKCLYSILEIDISDVEVKIEDKPGDKDNVAGLCCLGGKLLIFQTKEISELIDHLVKCVCHECYHSFQYNCQYNGFKSWHFDELGVTESRVKEWIDNFANYIDITTEFIPYRYQVVESDANSFANECYKASELSYNKIDLE